MKKTIITAAIILTTGAIATSGVKLLNNKEQKAQYNFKTINLTVDKQIASAD